VSPCHPISQNYPPSLSWEDFPKSRWHGDTVTPPSPYTIIYFSFSLWPKKERYIQIFARLSKPRYSGVIDRCGSAPEIRTSELDLLLFASAPYDLCLCCGHLLRYKHFNLVRDCPCDESVHVKWNLINGRIWILKTAPSNEETRELFVAVLSSMAYELCVKQKGLQHC